MPGGNSVLIPFDCVVNLDYGIVKLLQKEYNNQTYMNDFLTTAIDPFIRYTTIINASDNIVRYYLRNDHKDKADIIKESLFKERYEDIIKLSETTGIFTLIEQFNKIASGAIQTTILCKNELEQQHIKSLNKKLGTIVSSMEDLDLSIYDTIYFRDIKQSATVELAGKNIYILNYRFNFEDEFKTLLRPITILVADVNVFRTIDVYSELETPAG